MAKDSIGDKQQKSIRQMQMYKDLIEELSGLTVFTPLNEARTKRLRFDREDVEVIEGELFERKLGYKARIKIKGKTYEAFGIDCDLPGCTCDGYIKEVA